MSTRKLTRAQRVAGMMAVAASLAAPAPTANVAVQMIGGFGLVRNLIPRSRPWPWWVGAGKRELTYQSRVARRAR